MNPCVVCAQIYIYMCIYVYMYIYIFKNICCIEHTYNLIYILYVYTMCT